MPRSIPYPTSKWATRIASPSPLRPTATCSCCARPRAFGATAAAL
nr:MAG TPA: hypothetical protein [Caudoviricetes sp.]